MAVVTEVLDVSPDKIRAALADGWSYADWVVGAVHVRAVDESWPAPGSAVHHRLGGWPVTLDDLTRVTAWDPAGTIEMLAKLRPFGAATVRVTWQPADRSSRVTMEENFVDGAGRLAQNPIGQAILRARNRECLSRLADLCRRY